MIGVQSCHILSCYDSFSVQLNVLSAKILRRDIESVA